MATEKPFPENIKPSSRSYTPGTYPQTESITYTDEGLIEVSTSHAPLLSDGTLATINYNENDDFTNF